jgi:hypothetical protein
VAQHQIKSTESRCCGHNVASWWVARFAIVARHFQIIQKLFRIPVEFSKFNTYNDKDSNVGKTTTNHPPVSMMEEFPQFRRQTVLRHRSLPTSLFRWQRGALASRFSLARGLTAELGTRTAGAETNKTKSCLVRFGWGKNWVLLLSPQIFMLNFIEPSDVQQKLLPISDATGGLGIKMNDYSYSVIFTWMTMNQLLMIDPVFDLR